MLILFENNIPRGLARALVKHIVIEARDRGWAALQNGDLLNAAEDAGFAVMVTADKRIKYQQNLEGRKIALVVLTQGRSGPVRKKLSEIASAVDAVQPGSYIEVELPYE